MHQLKLLKQFRWQILINCLNLISPISLTAFELSRSNSESTQISAPILLLMPRCQSICGTACTSRQRPCCTWTQRWRSKYLQSQQSCRTRTESAPCLRVCRSSTRRWLRTSKKHRRVPCCRCPRLRTWPRSCWIAARTLWSTDQMNHKARQRHRALRTRALFCIQRVAFCFRQTEYAYFAVENPHFIIIAAVPILYYKECWWFDFNKMWKLLK